MKINKEKVNSLKPYKYNPKKHPDSQIDKIANSIKKFGFKVPLLITKEKEVIAGHGRLLASKKLEMDKVPVIIVDDLTEAEIKAFRIADNKTTESDWDNELLLFELEGLEEMDFDLDLTGFGAEEIDSIFREDEEIVEKIDEAEEKLDNVFVDLAKDYIESYEKLNGFQTITKSYAEIKFLRALYYKERYPRYCSLAFHPEQFVTNGKGGKGYSVKEALERIASGELTSGYARFLSKSDMRYFTRGSLPIHGGRMPLDYPVELARDIMNEFGNNGKILDPSLGWGGRLIGFLLSDTSEYTGCDPAPKQIVEAEDIYKRFSKYTSDKKANFIEGAFEDITIKDKYDLVFTCPPYYDVEQYEGGKQAVDYKDYNEFKEKFYKVFIEKSFKALKKGGYFVINVGSQSYPLKEDGIAIAKDVGFNYIESRSAGIKNAKMKTPEETEETLLIFKK